MIEQTTRYGISTTVDYPYETALERVRAALAKQGFGILTEIDVRATMKKKLGAEFRPYIILGACNPSYAFKALSVEIDIGLLLPCNVVVYASDEPGKSVVAAMDPVAAMSLTGNDAVGPIANEVRGMLEQALADAA